jgi:hypothetical protein
MFKSSYTFWYMCGEMTYKSQTPLIKKCYELHFGCKVGDQDKSLVPLIYYVMCGSCQMLFAIPMVWCERKDHLSNLLLLFNKHNGDHLQIQTHIEVFRFAICNESCPTQWRVSCTKTSGKSDSDHKRQAGGQCWLRSYRWRKLFLIWTPFI